MASKDTKEKILEAALSLFNEMGFVNVRLQHISDVTVISLGNITYHFRTKDDIMLALWKDIEQQQRMVLTESRLLPLFEDIDRYLEINYALQHMYNFFYKDTLELHRAYTGIAEYHLMHMQWQAQQLENILNFNVARGALIHEPVVDQYQKLAQLWVDVSESWIYRTTLCQRPDTTDAYKANIWLLIYPYFTQQGKAEFQQLSDLKNISVHA